LKPDQPAAQMQMPYLVLHSPCPLHGICRFIGLSGEHVPLSTGLASVAIVIAIITILLISVSNTQKSSPRFLIISIIIRLILQTHTTGWRFTNLTGLFQTRDPNTWSRDQERARTALRAAAAAGAGEQRAAPAESARRQPAAARASGGGSGRPKQWEAPRKRRRTVSVRILNLPKT
jgi:hypothetical protein